MSKDKDPYSLPRSVGNSDYETAIARYSEAANNFGIMMLSTLLKSKMRDVIISPLSIHQALIMTANGALEGTLSELGKVLGYGPITSGREILDTYAPITVFEKSETIKLPYEIVNSLWVSKDVAVEKPYLEESKSVFNGEVQMVSFKDSKTAKTINSFIKTKTHGLIDNVIDKVNSDDLMYIVNTLYFKDEWSIKFNDAIDKDFHYFGGSVQKRPLMSFKKHIRYADIGIAQTCLLQFKNGRVGMLIALPKDKEEKGLVECAEHLFNNEDLKSTLSKLNNVEVNLTIPKFKLSFSSSLKDALISMGAPTAFTDRANFYHMAPKGTGGSKAVCIGDVIHQTVLDVNESGVEAAAATVVRMMMCMACAPRMSIPIIMNVNRPFAVALVDVPKNLAFFTGVICNP